jgi:hypothetical protein
VAKECASVCSCTLLTHWSVETLLIMHKSKMILGFYGVELLMLLMFLGYYTVWLWAVFHLQNRTVTLQHWRY